MNSSHANLSGRFVLITGASRGISKARALSFARAGTSCIAITSRSVKDLDPVELLICPAAKDVGKLEPRVLKVSVDVMDAALVDDLAKAVKKAFRRLDILMNNAGVLEQFEEIAGSDSEFWWKTWEANIRKTYLVTRAFLPVMVAEGGEKIVVVISSTGVHSKYAGASSHETSKLALLRFTGFIKTEYGPKGILAIAYRPGGVPTEMGLSMPKKMQEGLVDTAELAADGLVWSTEERRRWLAGRHVGCIWDVEEFEAMKNVITRGDKLRVILAV